MQKKISFVDLLEKFIDEGRVVLPVFNTTAMKVQQELAREEPDMKVLVSTISGDQSLSSQVLQIANSAFYKGLVEVATIQSAIVRLGMAEIGRISLMASTKSHFRSKDKDLNSVMKKLWQHSVGCAMAAKWIAKRCELDELDSEAFFAALLHDVGKLVVLMVIEQMRKKGKQVKMTSSLLLEVMDSLHCQQGYKLMKKWNIPEKYCIVARDHHDTEFDHKDLLLVVVRVADMACRKLGIGVTHFPELAVAASDEAQMLNLTEIDLAELEILLEDTKALSG